MADRHKPREHADSVLIDRFAWRVRERFPGAPSGEAARIARFACARATDRVGALVGVDGYLDHAVELAVVAHLRHRFTRYERLLRDGHDRDDARALVQSEVIELLRRWGGGPIVA